MENGSWEVLVTWTLTIFIIHIHKEFLGLVMVSNTWVSGVFLHTLSVMYCAWCTFILEEIVIKKLST